MATYPIKMLKDEEGKPFVPLISIDSIKEVGGETLEQQLDKKLETTNIIAGTQIALEVEGNNVIISNSAEGTKLINNLDQTTVGVGALDAAQGKVLKESIPEVINNLTTIDSKKALSAHQGYILAGRSVPVGGGTGQVLMKSADDDYSLIWGDAADPNAIIGDGSIKKIVELTYNEYIALEEAGQLEDTTEYHISDMNEQGGTYITETEIQDMIKGNVVNSLTSTSTVNALSAAQGKALNDKIDKKVRVMRIAQTQGIQWTPSTTPTHMPYNTVIYDTSEGLLTSPNSGYIVVGPGVHQVRINGQFTTDHVVDDESYIFCYLYRNETQIFKKIRPTLRWDTIGINNVIIDVNEGDVIDVRISTNLSDTLLLAWSNDYEGFGPGTMSYLQVEILA